MHTMACQITGNSTVCSTIHSGSHGRIHPSPMLLTPCEGKPPVISGFPAQRASSAENVSMSWHHHVMFLPCSDVWAVDESSVLLLHYGDIIIGTMASQITSLTIVYSIVYSDVDQRKHQSSTSLAFVQGIHRRPVNSPHKWPVTWKMFLFHDVIMAILQATIFLIHIWARVENQETSRPPVRWQH